jgi:predicted polyphosphate/ATP-dependent NAD kinase
VPKNAGALKERLMISIEVLMPLFHIGLIINPLAGVGGPAGFKGSDGMAEAALAAGVEPRAAERTRAALEVLAPLRERLMFRTFAGGMGADLLAQMGFAHEVLGDCPNGVSDAGDTRRAVERLQDAGVALILFAGGDGTARDVAHAVREGQPVLGIPAGVKIQSGVYAISPRAAGELTRRLVEGGLVRLASGEVRDLDEVALREGRLASRWFGELTVPEEGGYLQQVKQGGVESEELVLSDLAAWLEADWLPDVRYVFGPGSTLHGLAQNLGLETTLLGVDVIEAGQVIARDVSEAELFEWVNGHPAQILVTAIGGQGHILGRGNQQISPRVLRAVGLEHLRVVATKRKLGTLDGRPLLVDSGDALLDDAFPDVVRVWAGYKEELLYPVSR